MSTLQQIRTNRVRVMWLAVALALIAVFSYLLIQGEGDNVLSVQAALAVRLINRKEGIS